MDDRFWNRKYYRYIWKYSTPASSSLIYIYHIAGIFRGREFWLIGGNKKKFAEKTFIGCLIYSNYSNPSLIILCVTMVLLHSFTHIIILPRYYNIIACTYPHTYKNVSVHCTLHMFTTIISILSLKR